jgi:hypothetical protein
MDRVSAPKYRVDELLAALTMENITLRNIISQLSHELNEGLDQSNESVDQPNETDDQPNENVDRFEEEPDWIGAGEDLIKL